MSGRLTVHPRRSVGAIALAIAVVFAVSGRAPAASSFAVGRDAHLSGRHAEAVAAFRAHLAASPRDARAWVWLGASYYQLGDNQEAIAAFERAAALAPSGEVALWLGASHSRMGREADARRAFLTAARTGHPQTAMIAQQWLRASQGRAVPVLDRAAGPDAYASVARWYNASLQPHDVDAIVRSVLYYSNAYGIDPRLAMALIAVESGFRVTAQSPVGAYGLGQLMPATWRAMGIHPADPVANIYATVRVLKGQLDRFGGNVALALAAYNAGRGAVERHGGIPPFHETKWYVYNVLTLYQYLAGIETASRR